MKKYLAEFIGTMVLTLLGCGTFLRPDCLLRDPWPAR